MAPGDLTEPLVVADDVAPCDGPARKPYAPATLLVIGARQTETATGPFPDGSSLS